MLLDPRKVEAPNSVQMARKELRARRYAGRGCKGQVDTFFTYWLTGMNSQINNGE